MLEMIIIVHEEFKDKKDISLRQTNLSAPFCVNMLQSYHNQALPVALRIPIKCW